MAKTSRDIGRFPNIFALVFSVRHCILTNPNPNCRMYPLKKEELVDNDIYSSSTNYNFKRVTNDWVKAMSRNVKQGMVVLSFDAARATINPKT